MDSKAGMLRACTVKRANINGSLQREAAVKKGKFARCEMRTLGAMPRCSELRT